MNNQQNNNDHNVHIQKNITTAKTDEQSHFIQAQKIIERWPEWKRNIRCVPISTNCNQSNKPLDKK